MKILRPDATDPFENLEAQRCYEKYLALTAFPETVQSYVGNSKTREHGSEYCPHDYYLESVTARDPNSGSDIQPGEGRISFQMVLFCPKRLCRLNFEYFEVYSLDCEMSKGRWLGKFKQVIQDEVTVEENWVTHEWYLDYSNRIYVKCRSFRFALNQM